MMTGREVNEQLPMYRRFTLASCMLALLLLPGVFVVSVLADYSDRRQIIVFATPSSESGNLVQRLTEELHCQLIARDTDVRFVDITDLPEGPDDPVDAERNEKDVIAELAQLRGDVKSDFELVLIGKDGGVKARTSDPSALPDFLALIDTMPMRRAEMRSRVDGDGDCE